jgi:hypothetical protein
MLTLKKDNVILWEAESIITNVVLTEEKVEQHIEQKMQEEPFYGEPDFSYY